ncbi:MAG: AIR synthase-related protein, partial [Bryobacteraceae bacterium]
VIGLVGTMPLLEQLGPGFRAAGRALYLIGGPGEADETRMGGTQYAKQVLRSLWGLPPEIDFEPEKRVQAAVREMVRAGAVESAHDVSDGGLAWCLAECTFPHETGARVELDSGLRPELLLFHEGPSRVVVSTAQPARVEEIASRHGAPAVRIGETGGGELVIANRGARLIDARVRDLKQCWSEALERWLHAGQEIHA